MRIALISDVHGNLEALEAVLDDIDINSPGAKVVCAGDLVGYGPDPEACIDRLRARNVPCIIGNHEEMVLGRRDFSRCARAGITAAVWTRKRLSSDAWEFLDSLPPRLEAAPDVIVCHGDLEDADTYVSDAVRADQALKQLASGWPGARILVCGHTHHPALYSRAGGFDRVPAPTERALPPDTAHIINPGAVGQSRDDQPLARYAVLDLHTDTVRFRALPYDHGTTIAKARQAGLVPSVILLRPRGAGRYVEALRRRWARHRAERASVASAAGPR